MTPGHGRGLSVLRADLPPPVSRRPRSAGSSSVGPRAARTRASARRLLGSRPGLRIGQMPQEGFNDERGVLGSCEVTRDDDSQSHTAGTRRTPALRSHPRRRRFLRGLWGSAVGTTGTGRLARDRPSHAPPRPIARRDGCRPGARTRCRASADGLQRIRPAPRKRGEELGVEPCCWRIDALPVPYGHRPCGAGIVRHGDKSCRDAGPGRFSSHRKSRGELHAER